MNNENITQQKHYERKIQPIEYIHANHLTFDEGNVVKYVTRHADKDKDKDVRKSIVYSCFILSDAYEYTDMEFDALFDELRARFGTKQK